MKASLQHLGLDIGNEPIKCYWVIDSKFGFYWHYHPEFEITYIQKGHGMRMVGDNVGYFEEGDFVFLSSNLPHTWISDDDFNQSAENMEVVVLQFSADLFSGNFLELPEMNHIKQLFQRGARGMKVAHSELTPFRNELIHLIDLDGFERFEKLLHLLNGLGKLASYELLTSQSYLPNLNKKTEARLQKVCQFIHNEFTNTIYLEEVAKLANMNKTSFCRFFRQSTGQSLSQYVTDLRIGKACNLLLDDQNYSISEIAYMAGYRSQTLFNRSFLNKKKMSPSAFRKLKQSK